MTKKGPVIGNVALDTPLVLAPMAGVTDLPFRLLCKEQGGSLAYTEMVSAKAILYKNKNTRELLQVREEEHPIAVQLFGSDPAIMAAPLITTIVDACSLVIYFSVAQALLGL